MHWYGIIIASAVLIAVWLAMREARARGVNDDHILNLVLWALPFALIGARLYYVAFEWPYYAKHPARSSPFGTAASRFTVRLSRRLSCF